MSEGQGMKPVGPRRQGQEIRISLRGVRRLVTGRMKRGTRVLYQGDDGRLVTSERLVMRRARKAGYGCFRLRPYLWRLLPHLAPTGTAWGSLPPSRDGDDLLVATLRRHGPKLIAMLSSSFPTARLQKLATRHAGADVDPTRPGVPDLLVYKKSTKGPHAFRFIEVKRPKERLRAHQAAEIAFMRHLGMKAGVLRLVEAESASIA